MRSSPSTSLSTANDDRLSSLLASSAFSVSDYLNLALSKITDNDGQEYEAIIMNNATSNNNADDDLELEQRMASLALQLQISTQSCHDEIGRIGAELQAIVPRCAADVTRVESGLEGMELDVRGLLDAGLIAYDGAADHNHHKNSHNGSLNVIHGPDVSGGGSSNNDHSITNNNNHTTAASISSSATTSFHNNNNQDDDANATNNNPLSTLHSLLNLKTHLTTTRSILAAASSWDETINSIPKLLSNNTTINNNTKTPNLIEAVAALTKLEQGARALQFMPEGQSERSTAITKLRTQLEVLLKPQLLHALNKMDTGYLGPLQQCVGMYASLNKLDVMREEYVRMRPGGVISLWFSFGSGSSSSGGGSGKGGKGGVMEEEEKVEEETVESDEEDDDEEAEAEDFDFSEEQEVNAITTTNKVCIHILSCRGDRKTMSVDLESSHRALSIGCSAEVKYRLFCEMI